MINQMFEFRNKLKIKLLFLIVLCFLSVIFLYNFKEPLLKKLLPFNDVGKYQIISIGNKLKLITFNNSLENFEKVVEDYEMPAYYNDRESWIRNLNSFHNGFVKLSGKNNFWIIQRWKSNNYLIQEVSVDGNNILVSRKYNGNLPVYYEEDPFFAGLSLDNMLITMRGQALKIDSNGDLRKILTMVDEQELFINSKMIINSGVYLNKETVIFQAIDYTTYKNFKEIGTLLSNRLIVYSLSERKIIRTIKYGFSPICSSFTTYHQNYLLPLSLSPDSKKLAFIARLQNTDKSMKSTIYEAPLWLCTLDLSTYSIKQVLKLNLKDDFPSYTIPNQLSWNTKGYVNLITFSGKDIIRSGQENKVKGKSVVIDLNQNKIFNQWPWESKSMRWSSNGRYLGMLRKKTYDSSNPDNVKEAGSIYIYDLETDVLEKIDQDKTNFDFFWLD